MPNIWLYFNYSTKNTFERNTANIWIWILNSPISILTCALHWEIFLLLQTWAQVFLFQATNTIQPLKQSIIWLHRKKQELIRWRAFSINMTLMEVEELTWPSSNQCFSSWTWIPVTTMYKTWWNELIPLLLITNLTLPSFTKYIQEKLCLPVTHQRKLVSMFSPPTQKEDIPQITITTI